MNICWILERSHQIERSGCGNLSRRFIATEFVIPPSDQRPPLQPVPYQPHYGSEGQGQTFHLLQARSAPQEQDPTLSKAAVQGLQAPPGPVVPCPIPTCNATTDKKRDKASGFLYHVKMWHSEQLWEDDTEEVGDDVVAGMAGDSVVADATGGGTAQDSEDEMLFGRAACSNAATG
ncbi:hypothetical protein E8E11_004590 [Didymella keratinophila]|nr:hypothetical protein E8E11_004590 [Didymella keratinophila]